MQGRRTHFRQGLDDSHVLDVDFHVHRSRVIGFAVNLRRLQQGQWHTVERIDAHHGHLHRHRFSTRGESIRDLSEPVDRDYTQALRDAVQHMNEVAHAHDPQ